MCASVVKTQPSGSIGRSSGSEKIMYKYLNVSASKKESILEMIFRRVLEMVLGDSDSQKLQKVHNWFRPRFLSHNKCLQSHYNSVVDTFSS